MRERFLDWYYGLLYNSVQKYYIYKLTVFLHWFIKVGMFLIQSTTNF